jgi:hypothetical protein
MIGEGVERMRVAELKTRKPHPENRRARHPTASLKWIFLDPTTRLRGAGGNCPVTAFIRPATMQVQNLSALATHEKGATRVLTQAKFV